jgi:hypothetical protein
MALRNLLVLPREILSFALCFPEQGRQQWGPHEAQEVSRGRSTSPYREGRPELVNQGSN